MLTIIMGFVGNFLSSKAGPALFLVMGVIAAGGAIAYKFEHDAHLTTTERLTRDVKQAEDNSEKFEKAYNDEAAQFTIHRKEEIKTKAENKQVLKDYAEIKQELLDKEAKYQKRLKQYEQVFIKKPELYSRAYAKFYARELRELEKVTGSSGEGDSSN